MITRKIGFPVGFRELGQGGPPRSAWSGGRLFILAPLPDSSGELVLGPLPHDPQVARNRETLGVLPALLAALAGLFTAVPMARSIRALEKTARTMQEGNLTARAKAEHGDPLASVGLSLNDLADRIDQLLSDERDLMRTVAHEVRAPIARMHFRVEMLQEAVSAQHRRHATGLVGDLGQVDELFEELLTYVAFDEFDQERPSLQTQTFAAGEAVQAVVDGISGATDGKTIQISGDPETPVVANRKLFDRAVSNLINNAVAYSESSVNVVLRRHPRACVVDVQDDGAGIPEAERSRVVKPFVRLDSGDKKPKGTGLGLAIVKRIMRLHKGGLHIVDAPRGGASVQLVWENSKVSAQI